MSDSPSNTAQPGACVTDLKRRRTSATLTDTETPSVMTNTQREVIVKQALTRFVRSRNLPNELEDLRYKLIQARVMQGMTAVEAAEMFGYANSTQLSLIESCARPTPNDWRFLKQAAVVYGVSVDWLLGLSPNMEPDAKVAHQYALLRTTEGIVNGFITQLTTAMIQAARETQPVAEDLQRVVADVDSMIARFDRFAAQEAFEDMPGGAPVAAAVQRLSSGVAPLRAKLKKFKGIEAYLAEVKNGTLPPIDYLTERFDHADTAADILGDKGREDA